MEENKADNKNTIEIDANIINRVAAVVEEVVEELRKIAYTQNAELAACSIFFDTIKCWLENDIKKDEMITLINAWQKNFVEKQEKISDQLDNIMKDK